MYITFVVDTTKKQDFLRVDNITHQNISLPTVVTIPQKGEEQSKTIKRDYQTTTQKVDEQTTEKRDEQITTHKGDAQTTTQKGAEGKVTHKGVQRTSKKSGTYAGSLHHTFLTIA